MDVSSSRSAADALVVVVPQPDGRGLVTVVGSGVGVGGPAGRGTAKDVEHALKVALAGGDGSIPSRLDVCVAKVQRSDGWYVQVCGEDLPGAEPIEAAKARRARIVPRVAAALRTDPCGACGCDAWCRWALQGDLALEAVSCADCGCAWCGPLYYGADGPVGTTEKTVGPQVTAVLCDPNDRLRRALDAFDDDSTPATLEELRAAARGVLAVPASANARLLAAARQVIDHRGGPSASGLEALVWAVDACEEAQRLGPVELAARVLDGADEPALALRLRDGAPANDVLATLRGRVGSETTADETRALAALGALVGGPEAGRAALLAHAKTLEVEAERIPIGAVERGGPLDDAPTHSVIRYAARRARAAAGSL